MDDDFATIVAAVEEGRGIYKNMQAFVCFLLSCNFPSRGGLWPTCLGVPDVRRPCSCWVRWSRTGRPRRLSASRPTRCDI